jgi:HK97 family phage prohead protease
VEKIRFHTPANAVKFQVITPELPDGDKEDADEEVLPTLKGYAIVWNAISTDARKASIAPGSVKFTNPVLAMYGHDDKCILGNTANGTLTLTQDSYGLLVSITPPDTSYARDVCELVEDGYVAGMSFGMFGNDFTDKDGVRTYTDILVDEVTITAVPAFPQTSISIDEQADGDYSKKNDKVITADRDRHEITIMQINLSEMNLD